MDRGPYRDAGRPRSARVYRGSTLTFLKLAALLLFCLASVAGLLITADDGFELGRAAVTALMAAASLV